MRTAGGFAQFLTAQFDHRQQAALFHPGGLPAEPGDVVGAAARIDVAGLRRIGGEAMFRRQVEGEGVMLGKSVEEALALVGKRLEHGSIAQGRQHVPGIPPGRTPARLTRFDDGDRNACFGQVQRQR